MSEIIKICDVINVVQILGSVFFLLTLKELSIKIKHFPPPHLVKKCSISEAGLAFILRQTSEIWSVGSIK
jgi:hypothetical protein